MDIVVAKSNDLDVAKSKQYAQKLILKTTYSTNGKEIYSIYKKTGTRGLVAYYLTPEELWHKTFAAQNEWREKFSAIPFETIGGTKPQRFYQEIVINNMLEAVAIKKTKCFLP